MDSYCKVSLTFLHCSVRITRLITTAVDITPLARQLHSNCSGKITSDLINALTFSLPHQLDMPSTILHWLVSQLHNWLMVALVDLISDIIPLLTTNGVVIN